MIFFPTQSSILGSTSLLFLLAFTPLKAETDVEYQVRIENAPLAKLPPESIIREGVSGGLSHGALLQIGGADSNGRCLPLAMVLQLPAGTNEGTQWKKESLKEGEGRAWAATVQHGDEVIAIGGLVDGIPSPRVTAYQWNGHSLQSRELAPLPSPVVGAGAAMVGETIHVVGGLSSPESRQPRRDVLMLDLAAGGKNWTALPILPGMGKVLPMVAGQYDVLEVIGGRTSDGKGGFNASRDVLIYRSKPAEGTTLKGWSHGADLPVAMAGGTAAPSGQAHTIIFGADTTPSVTNPISLTAGTDSPTLLFHVVTDAWVKAGTSLKSLHPSLAKTEEGLMILFGGKGSTDILRATTPRTTRNLNWADYLMILFYFFFH